MGNSESRDSHHRPATWDGSNSFVNQGTHWSSSLIWISSTLFAVTLIWAFTSKIDQTISVRGQLEPAGSVKDVDSPSTGVIKSVFVKEGQRVKVGQPLFELESTGLLSRQKALSDSIRLNKISADTLQLIINTSGDSAKISSLPPIPKVDDSVLSSQLTVARNQSLQLTARLAQLNTQLKSRTKSLSLRRQLASDYKGLYQQSAISRHAYLTELDQVQTLSSQVASLQEEKSRVLGEAALQLNRVNQDLIELKAQLSSVTENLGYRKVLAPASGVVFNLNAGPSSVVSTSDRLLTIVPRDALQAVVNIPNDDIGFLRPGLPASVGVDSFPAGEFGYIQGTLESIGSDSVKSQLPGAPPEFPATISLSQQTALSGTRTLNLQSGMSITANIKLRSRPAISIVTDLFTKQMDGLKRFR